MCGRFTLRTTAEILAAEFDLAELPRDLRPRFNIAPTQSVAVIPNRAPRRLDLFRWGLVPRWAKDASVGARMINARAETLAAKPSFRESFARRRCLVPADGFYEWKRDGRGKKPVFVRLASDRVFAFAGLWDVWRDPSGEELHSCTIVTTEPSDLIASIHARMPVILPRTAYDEWLEPGPVAPGDLSHLLRPFVSEGLEAYEVSTFVNSPRNDGPQCIEPTAAPRI